MPNRNDLVVREREIGNQQKQQANPIDGDKFCFMKHKDRTIDH